MCAIYVLRILYIIAINIIIQINAIENADRWNCQNMEMTAEYNWNKYLKIFPIYHFSIRSVQCQWWWPFQWNNIYYMYTGKGTMTHWFRYQNKITPLENVSGFISSMGSFIAHMPLGVLL